MPREPDDYPGHPPLGPPGRTLADPRVMPFGEHLEELRRRVIRALLVVVPIFIAAVYFGRELLNFVLAPAREELASAGLPPGLIATGPLETFSVYLKVAFVVSIVIGVPVILYQVWAFVKPGLYPHERRFAQFLVPLSVALSAAGLAFLYYVMLPAMLSFLIGFGSTLGRPAAATAPIPAGVTLPSVPILDDDPPASTPGQMWINLRLKEFRVDVTPAAPAPPPQPAAPTPAAPAGEPQAPASATAPAPAPERLILGTPLTLSSGIAQQYRVSEYVDLVLLMSVGFVLGFQTPVVVLLLGWAGIVERRTLARSRKYALFISFVVAAVLTPSPDPFNMTLLAVPLYILFELGLFLLRVFPPRRVARGIRASDLVNPVADGAEDEKSERAAHSGDHR